MKLIDFMYAYLTDYDHDDRVLYYDSLACILGGSATIEEKGISHLVDPDDVYGAYIEVEDELFAEAFENFRKAREIKL